MGRRGEDRAARPPSQRSHLDDRRHAVDDIPTYPVVMARRVIPEWREVDEEKAGSAHRIPGNPERGRVRGKGR